MTAITPEGTAPAARLAQQQAGQEDARRVASAGARSESPAPP